MYIFTDLETTGLNPYKHDIITGCMIATDDKYKIIDELDFKCKPETWSMEAQKVHKITKWEASEFPSKKQTNTKILQFLNEIDADPVNTHLVIQSFPHTIVKGADTIHGNFDYAFLHDQFRQFDMLYDFRSYISDHMLKNLYHYMLDLKFPKKRLDAAAKYCGVKFEHHDARSDTECLMKCWIKLESIIRGGEL